MKATTKNVLDMNETELEAHRKELRQKYEQRICSTFKTGKII